MAKAASTHIDKAAIRRERFRLFARSMRNNWRLFMASKIGPIGLGIIIFFALFSLSYPAYMAYRHNNQIYDPVMGFDYDLMPATNPHPPTPSHPLGTDAYGRDILSQLMYSTGHDLLLGLIAAGAGVFLATLVGSIAAFYGGFVDAFFMRVADLVMLFPLLATLVALSAMTKVSLFMLALILAILTGFGGTAIVLKSQALQVKVKPFIEAARVSGGSNFHIIWSHIVPNVLPLSFLYMMFSVTGAIFTEAALAFLGFLNVKMSLGMIIQYARSSGYLVGRLMVPYWYMWLPPGLVISLLCAGFYFIGRGLDEVVNPRLRER